MSTHEASHSKIVITDRHMPIMPEHNSCSPASIQVSAVMPADSSAAGHCFIQHIVDSQLILPDYFL